MDGNLDFNENGLMQIFSALSIFVECLGEG